MAKLKGISNLPYGLSGAQLFCRLDSLLDSKQSMTVGNNTILRRTGRYSDIALRLHGTDVVTISSSGDITLDSNGYETVTTKERMNQLLRHIGCGVYQSKKQWFISANGIDWPFVDGFTIPNAATCALNRQLDKIGA